MDTFKQQHIDTIDEVIEVLHTSGYNYTSLKNRLEQVKAKMLESQKRGLEEPSLDSIGRDLRRLEVINRNITGLKGMFLELEAEALELQRHILEKL